MDPCQLQESVNICVLTQGARLCRWASHLTQIRDFMGVWHKCLLRSYVLLQLVTTLSISVHDLPFTKALRKASACSRYPLSLISCKQLQKYQGVNPWGFMDTKTTIRSMMKFLRPHCSHTDTGSYEPLPVQAFLHELWGEANRLQVLAKAETSNLIV